jgi:hypothetical protein
LAELVASYTRLLQHLVQLGLVGANDVRAASERQKEIGGDVLEALLEGGMLHEQELAGALASFYRVPQVNLTRVRVTKQALRQANAEFCRQHQVLPFALEHQTGELLVALGNPSQVSAIDALRFRHAQNVRVYIAPRSQLREAIEFYYFSDHGESRPTTGPPRTGPAQRPLTSPRAGSGLMGSPSSSAGASGAGDSGLGDAAAFRSPVSRDYYSAPDEAAMLRGLGPGTEELGSVSPVPSPSGELFGSEHRGSSGRLPSPEQRSDPTVSGLGELNPYRVGGPAEPTGDLASRVERLVATVEQLEKALRYELSVSQALAEILVENGLISSEQLKSRLRKG